MLYKSQIPSNFLWSMIIDLNADLNNEILAILKNKGCTDIDYEHILYQYFNLQRRQLERYPRKVYYSKELKCPEEYKPVLRDFVKKVEAGDDLMPFQSDKIKKANYSDLLLNDWNIQHFHLSGRYRDDGFVKRSEYQIFAYVTDDSLYLIQIYPHKDSDLYCKQEMIRILQNNWPELIAKYRLKDACGTNFKMDDRTYGTLREANISTVVETKGNVYAMIGGGYMSDGSSMDALRKSDYWKRRLSTFQAFIVKNGDSIARIIATINGKDDFEPMDIQLGCIENRNSVIVYEKNSNHSFRVDIKKKLIESLVTC